MKWIAFVLTMLFAASALAADPISCPQASAQASWGPACYGPCEMNLGTYGTIAWAGTEYVITRGWTSFGGWESVCYDRTPPRPTSWPSYIAVGYVIYSSSNHDYYSLIQIQGGSNPSWRPAKLYESYNGGYSWTFVADLQ